MQARATSRPYFLLSKLRHMTRIHYYRRTNPLDIMEARPVPSEDAESWVREANEEYTEFYYFIQD